MYQNKLPYPSAGVAKAEGLQIFGLRPKAKAEAEGILLPYNYHNLS